jgi:hypothetical protein
MANEEGTVWAAEGADSLRVGLPRCSLSSDTPAMTFGNRAEPDAKHEAVRRLAASLGVNLPSLDMKDLKPISMEDLTAVLQSWANGQVPTTPRSLALYQKLACSSDSSLPGSLNGTGRHYSASESEECTSLQSTSQKGAGGSHDGSCLSDTINSTMLSELESAGLFLRGSPSTSTDGLTYDEARLLSDGRVTQLEEERDALVDRLLETTEALHASEARRREGAAQQQQVRVLYPQHFRVLLL